MSAYRPQVLAFSSDIHTFHERGQGQGLAFLRPGGWLNAVREPANPYDRNAILLYDSANGQLGYLGYLDRAVASSLAPRLDEGWTGCYLVSTAYQRQNDAWTVQVLAFCCRPKDYASIVSALTDISGRVYADRLTTRYYVAKATRRNDSYGLGFTLTSEAVPAAKT